MKKSLAILSAVLLSAGCALEYNSPSTFTDDYVYSTVDGISASINGIYNPILANSMYGWYSWSLFGTSDIEYRAMSKVAQNVLGDISQISATPYNTYLKTIWNAYWQAVGNANNCINGIENSPLFKDGDAMARHYHGEAVTLRAMLYYDLVRVWGDVPMVLKPMTADDDLAVSPTDRDEILSTMIEQLIEAEKELKKSSEAYGIERVGKEYCQALIARIALLRAGYSLRPDYNDPNAVGTMQRNEADYMDYYVIARDYTRKLIESGTHSLKADFRTVFNNEMNYLSPDGDDVIFELPFRSGPNGGSNVGYRNGIRIAEAAEEGNHYWGASSGEVLIPHIHMYTFDPEDSRRFVTGCMYQIMGTGRKQICNGNVYLGKWDKTLSTETLNRSQPTGVNFPMMRYADVLLMFAEAQNEITGGPDEQAREALKAVRRRAFSSYAKSDGYVDALTDHDSFFNAIVDERSWEFAGECIRRTDLVRWNLIGPKVRAMVKDWVQLSKDSNVAAGLYSEEGFVPVFNKPYLIYYYSGPNNEFDLKGFDEQLLVAPTAPDGSAYIKFGWCRGQWAREEGGWGPSEVVRASYYAWGGGQLEPDSDVPVRYILPIPQTTIDASHGALKNYYGYSQK